MKEKLALLWIGVVVLSGVGVARGGVYDWDDDGDVDLEDYVEFAGCISGPAVPSVDECDVFDGNADSHVDLWDFGGFQRAFTGPVEPDNIIRAQLAGNSLAEYPFFEYVKAFNEDAGVELAIDPTRYPEILGQTADVYIAEAKTAGAWAFDPTLTDETPDGPETVTFGGTSIQDNTFDIAGPYDLDSSVFVEATGDYTGLGHAYDMVVDMNRNGRLDNGDFIDGLSREAGLYVVHDTTQPGPLAVTAVASYSVGAIFGIPSYYTNEVLFYPTDIAGMEPLPLVVIGHGAGHQYTWYDHIGNHMASYGYIVMSHQNCGGPPDCTLGHTDAILHLQSSIAGGAIDGKIDASRIIWIGHSRGGEGVTRAFDALVEGTYSPTHYTEDSIVLVSAMLPIVNDDVDIYDVNFHLWTASGDTDVSGAAGWDLVDTFELHDRATRFRMSTVVQGTGHAWFHNGPEEPSWFSGECSIGQENTHKIELGLFLPLMKYYAEGNVPATDFFWRQYERFHPIGVDTSDPCIVVTNEYRNGSEEGNFFIEDYQSEEALDVSSSGGAVTYSVDNVLEGRLHDNNSSFSWTSSDPFNGATQAAAWDTTRGVVFDWHDADAFYEYEVIDSQRNFADDLYLSFRGAQGTQHPYTLAELGDLTFTVTLRDGAGTTSSINIGAYGGGLEQPYQRSGGWHNEMEINRIRTTDFLNNGSGLDLTDIVAVRFDFGPSWGSPEGRIVLDEVMLTNDYPPYFTPLTMALPAAVPEFIPPGEPTTIDVEILEGDDTLVEGSATLTYRYDGGAWQSVPLEQVVAELWRGTLPPPSCGDTPEYYFSAEGVATGPVDLPAGAPAVTFSSHVGTQLIAIDDDFETDLGWTVINIDLLDGQWERGIPAGDGTRGDPTEDYDGSGQCYLTANRAGNSDVDGGPTLLISPTLDMSGMIDPVMRYARWWSNDDQDGDPFDIDISLDDGDTWTRIERVANIGHPTNWIYREVRLADYVTEAFTDRVKVRFSCMDNPNNSVDEGAVDAVVIFDVACE